MELTSSLIIFPHLKCKHISYNFKLGNKVNNVENDFGSPYLSCVGKLFFFFAFPSELEEENKVGRQCLMMDLLA